MNKKYAVLDFDGTLIDGQSQRMLVKYLYRKGYITFTRYARIMLWYVGFKLGLAHDVNKIGNYAVGYLAGKKVDEFKPIFDDFFATECVPRIYKDSYELVSYLKGLGYGTTLLSTAIDPIISRACEHFGVGEYICTRLAVKDGVYLGTILGEPVYADNKARIIEMWSAMFSCNYLYGIRYLLINNQNGIKDQS